MRHRAGALPVPLGAALSRVWGFMTTTAGPCTLKPAQARAPVVLKGFQESG